LLVEKSQKWLTNRKESQERLQELSDLFSGTKALPRVVKNGKTIERQGKYFICACFNREPSEMVF